MATGPVVTVIGAGVIGLTCAHALQEAGYRVTVIASERPRVSDVAGGLWLEPHGGDLAGFFMLHSERPRRDQVQP